jgi:hypothetical protein
VRSLHCQSAGQCGTLSPSASLTPTSAHHALTILVDATLGSNAELVFASYKRGVAGAGGAKERRGREQGKEEEGGWGGGLAGGDA